MVVTPGLPKIGEQAYQDFFDGQTVDVMLFHDGNQSGHVEKPIQEVNTSADIVEVSSNVRYDANRGGFLNTGEAFSISGSTGNDGTYTVSTMIYNSNTDRTEITVNETIGDSIADGIAQFGNTNNGGRGDNLQDTDRLTDITTEPSDGGYTRATTALTKYDTGDGWSIRISSDTVFDNLTDTTGRVDAVAMIYNWQANGDSSSTDHILFTSFLDQLYVLDGTDKQTINKNTLSLSIE